ncbi:MAG TPA: HD domain-containing phosphohydrolase [Gemmatimonadaceae bacterium]
MTPVPARVNGAGDAASSCEELGRLPEALRVLIDEADAAEREGRRDVARARYEQALLGIECASCAPAAAALLRAVARTWTDDDDLDAALDCLEAALAISVAVGDVAGEAHGWNLMAIIRQQRGELDEAERLYLRSLDAATTSRDPRVVLMVRQNLGTIASIRGDLERALRHYQSALEGYRALGLLEPVSGLLSNMGTLYTWLERWPDAERAYDEAQAIADARDDAAARILVAVNRTEMWIARGQLDAARDTCDAALDLARRSGDARANGDIHKHYGVIARERGDLRRAEEHLARAREIAEQRQDLHLAAQTTREQAELFRRQERNRDTLRALTVAHGLFTRLRARRELADVRRRMAQLETMFLDIVRRWGDSIESKDNYTRGHCDRVADHACALARLAGLDESTLFWFRAGALLHDVGKIIVPSSILNKPGPLTPEERALMERHPAAGIELLADIEFPWDVRPMILHHHERWDGTGYPARLAGEAIPLAARILCVADVWDALTTARAYRPAFSPERALGIMRAEAGRTFDPSLFALFERVALAPRDPVAHAGPSWRAPVPHDARRLTGAVAR